ncbi:hypothetical protein [Kribbella sp. NPDC023855]|uniref:hypothetical protein n=1 Tax=Kribbella sp. NPDC023855 TaxID=3154698 RepID=UPI0033C06B6C
MNPATTAGWALRHLTDLPAHGISVAFAALATLRQAPAVHPRRVSFSARLCVEQQTPLIPSGQYLATVNLSKGAGTPGRRPDILGVALRFHLPSSPDPCDVLFSSAGTGRWTRWVPLPATDWGGARYGTLAPYEIAGRWWWLMLTPTGPPVGHASLPDLEHSAPVSFAVHLSGESAAWQQIGRLVLRDLLTSASPVLDPVLNHPPGAVPAPAWLRTVRELAYTSSRQGRRAQPPNN